MVWLLPRKPQLWEAARLGCASPGCYSPLRTPAPQPARGTSASPPCPRRPARKGRCRSVGIQTVRNNSQVSTSLVHLSAVQANGTSKQLAGTQTLMGLCIVSASTSCSQTPPLQHTHLHHARWQPPLLERQPQRPLGRRLGRLLGWWLGCHGGSWRLLSWIGMTLRIRPSMRQQWRRWAAKSVPLRFATLRLPHSIWLLRLLVGALLGLQGCRTWRPGARGLLLWWRRQPRILQERSSAVVCNVGFKLSRE